MNTSHKLTHTTDRIMDASPCERQFALHLPHLAALVRWAVMLGVLAALSTTLQAQGNFVYVNRNTLGPNSVAAFSVGANGALTSIGVFPTGGNGGGTSAAAKRETICVIGGRLYVSNFNSSNVSAFDINPATGALTAVAGSPFATGAITLNAISLACTPDGRFLIAASDFPDFITVFSVSANGALTQITGSPFATRTSGLNGVKITPDGKFLIASISFTDQVAVFSIAGNGALAPVAGSPFASPANGSSTGMDINCAGNLLFVAQAQIGGTNVDVFNIGANGALTPIPGSPFNFPGVGNNSNVAVLSPDNRFLFVSNQFSNTITVFNVAANGALTLVPGAPFANPGGSIPLQMATNQAGTLLNVINSNGTVSVFNIAGNGALAPVVGSPFAASSDAFPGIAAFPPASCPFLVSPPSLPSDQLPGSVLFYPVYTSNAASSNTQNARINITNTHPSLGAFLHLFFVDGSNCSVADSFMCLTPNQTATVLTSDIDPGTTGYIVAVATDRNGCPIDFNFLIGDEYVKFASGHAANLGAEAIAASASGLPMCDANAASATLNFNNVSYSALPRVLAASSLPARADGNDTLLVVDRVGGNLATGAATINGLFGLLYDDSEKSYSFQLAATACQLRSSLNNDSPRTVPRYDAIISAGRSGWLKLWGGTDVALFGAQLNRNTNATTSNNAFNQGHNLHKLTLTTTASYTIPVFPPTC